ncbi:MAG TPA: hypothetical protein VNF29_10905 [Candidatus Binataceae bacterium]|nr:hypothetical protein [Candidatus Binataceae bacterium]
MSPVSIPAKPRPDPDGRFTAQPRRRAAVPAAPQQSKQDHRHEALAKAYCIELQRGADDIARLLPKIEPGFDFRLLSRDDPWNDNWFDLLCGLTWHLDDGRKVPVEAIAGIVVALFFATLLARNGFAPPGFDLDGWNETRGFARRKRFMWLWLWLYLRTGPSGNTNSAPKWRASWEVAKKLLPGAAHGWEQDFNAARNLLWRRRLKSPAGKPAQETTK